MKTLTAHTVIMFLLLHIATATAQVVPAKDENIPFLVTFGSEADRDWGDDDFCQIFFVKLPEDFRKPFYVRIYDPDTGGAHDEEKIEFNTRVSYELYGGKGCWSNEDARHIDPGGSYKSGLLLESKTFGNEPEYDGKWYVFGPFNPLSGEFSERLNGYIFKIIAEGKSGDDGNLYRYAISLDPDKNTEIEGGNLFTYEYTFRLSNDNQNVSQIFPFIDENTISVKIMNFDWDDDGFIRIVSVAKNGLLCDVSAEGDWVQNVFPIIEEEKQTSLQIQFIKKRSALVKNNNVVLVVQNQIGESLPFYVIPIGGIPVYNPKLKMISVD